MTRLVYPHATAALPGGPPGTFTPEAGTITLDSTWSPYVQADATFPARLDEVFEETGLDPREGDRVVLTVAVEGHFELTGPTDYVEDPDVSGSLIPI